MTAVHQDNGSPETRHHVLVVAYYFPPMGGSGVQRVAKWCKYLPENGWDVTVLTVEPGAYFAFDEGLLAEVEDAGVDMIRTGSVDPTQVGKGGRRVGLQTERRRRLFAWLTGMFFLPDNKKGWMKPALEASRQLGREHPFDLVLSSAPPYTSLLIGATIAREARVPHVMDYRDDWLDNPRHRYPTPWHRSRHRQLEQRALASASFVTAINGPMSERISARFPGLDVRVLPQGYDPEDFPLPRHAGRTASKVRFLYAGMFYDAQQPDTFLRGVAQAIEQEPSLKSRIELRFVGLFPDGKRALVERLGLNELVTITGYLSHAETTAELMAADILWMTVGHQPGEEMISTGKLFEYMGTKKPIMALVPPGAAREALSGYAASRAVDPDDVEAVMSCILSWSREAEAGLLPAGDATWIEAFDRRSQTRTLAGWMDALVPGP